MSISASLIDLLRLEGDRLPPLGPEQFEALERHYQLLIQWNLRINLTTVTDVALAVTRHYGESLFLAARLSAGRIADVGSGAGFPGIPVAIARPDCSVDLIESHQRKAVFLREACRGMVNVRVLPVRAETLRSPAPELPYEWLISRAVNPCELAKLGIARRFAVLMGADDAGLLPSGEVVPLPWGDNRVISIGAFNSVVPRETLR